MRKIEKILIAVAILCVAYLFYHHGYLSYKPYDKILVDTPSYVTDLQQGEKIIVDKSRLRFYKVNADNTIAFIKEASRNSNENGFHEIDNLVADSKGNIYLLDIIRKDGGRRISKERILQYSSNGNYKKTVYEMNHEDSYVYKNEINRLEMIDDVLYFYQVCDSSYQVRTIQGIVREHKYRNAKMLLVDFTMNPLTHQIVLVDKLGKVLLVSEDNEYTCLYDGSQGMKFSIPWSVAFDTSGTLYWSDLAQRVIYKLEGKKSLPYIMANSMEVPEKPTMDDIKQSPIYYRIQACDNLVTTDSYGILTVEDDVIYETAYSQSAFILINIILVWIILFITIAIAVYFIILFIGYLVKKSSTTFKVVVGLMVGTIGFTILFTMLMLQNWNSRMTSEMLKRTAAASQLASQLINAEDLKSINSIDHYMNDRFAKIHRKMEKSLKSNEAWSESLYYVIYKIHNGIITTVMATEDYTGAIFPYDWPYEGSVEQQVIEEGISLSGVTKSAEGSFLYYVHPITDQKTGENVGIIEVGTDFYTFEKENDQIIFNFFINAIVISVVIILTTFEVLIFLQARKLKKQIVLNKEPILHNTKVSYVSIYRALVFLIFFVTNMTRGFFPLYVVDIVKNGNGLLGLSKELSIAIPMSAEVFFGAIMSICGYPIIKWIGRKKAAIVGSILFVFGLTIRAILPNILFMIIGNSVMGCGWGILLLIVQAAIAERPENEKNEGFAGYTAASLSGVNCGVVFGAFLINWISYHAVFIVVALLSCFSLVFTILFIKNTDKRVDKAIVDHHHEKGEIGTLRFITSPRVAIYFAAIVIPVVACGYFLYYLYPIIAADFNISDTNIGYSLLINGVCIICFGTILTKYFAKKYNKVISLAASSILYVIAFVLFALYQNIPVLMLSLLILGLSDSFGLPMQASYYTDLKEVRRYGYERSMGIYSLFENGAQTFGSFLFSYVLIIGVKKGLLYIAGALVILVILFIISGLTGKKKNENS